MRIIFMGTPDFATAVLKSVVEAGHDVIAVYTQPDRPKGRSAEMTPSSVKVYAQSRGLTVYQPERIRRPEWVAQLQSLAPDLILVAAFGQILPQSVLDIAPCVNAHASILPKYRGSSPIQRAIQNGDKETGVTAMRMDAGMDTGNILTVEKVPITATDTAETLHDKLADAAVRAIARVLERFDAGDALIGQKQDDTLATSAPMLSREEGKIDWTKSAEAIDWQIRAFTPWPGSYALLDGAPIKILKATPLSETTDAAPGTVLDRPKEIVIATGQGCLKVRQLQLSGKRAMQDTEFLLGKPIYGKVLA